MSDKQKKCIYKFNYDCGRMGEVTGSFAATETDMAEAMGRHVYFGEILGKHSDVSCVLGEEHITRVTDDPAIVAMFEKHDLGSGYNPLDYLTEDEGEPA